MKQTLKFKINAAILATFLLIVSLFLIIELPFEKQRYQSMQDKVILVLKTMMERDREPLANEIFDKSVRAIKIRLKKMMQVDGMLCVHVFDAQGNVLASEGYRHPLNVSLDFPGSPEKDTVSISKKRIDNFDTFEYVREIRIIGESIGFVVIYYSLEKIEKAHQKAFFIFGGMIFTVFVVLVILLNFMLSRTVVKPITSLRDVMEQMRITGKAEKAPVLKKDEIGDLARSFNHMSDEISASYDALEKKNLTLLQSENEINNVRLYLKNIIDSMPSVLVGINADGMITQWNREAEKFTGLAAEKTEGRFYTEVLPQVSVLTMNAIQSAIRNKTVQKKAKVQARVLDRSCYLDITLYPLAGGDTDEAVMRIDDITEHVRLEEAVQQSQKMEAIGTLAGGIAHDFNNILSGIFGYAQLAEMHLNDTERVKQHIGGIVKGAERASELVQQILTFSRKTDYEKQNLNLYIVVKEALKLLRSIIPSNIEIKEQITSRAAVAADPTQMHQVIMNLCTNAYHAMYENGGTLTVKLEEVAVPDAKSPPGMDMKPGQYLELKVSDTGYGMDADTLEKLFEPYFTTKVREKGTGLGLALVHAIVEEHQGYITVDSVPDKGASFHIYLPVADSKKPAAPHESKNKPVPQGEERILFVDDEKDLRFSSERLLQGYGYRVTVSENGMAAYELFKSDPHGFDLVITDMTMPRMTGDELAASILEIRPEIPVVLCTGYSEKISEKKARESGIKKFLQKPLTGSEMAIAIREVLDSPK